MTGPRTNALHYRRYTCLRRRETENEKPVISADEEDSIVRKSSGEGGLEIIMWEWMVEGAQTIARSILSSL